MPSINEIAFLTALFHALKVPVSKFSLKKFTIGELSFTSISWLLSFTTVKNLFVQLTPEHLPHLPLPAVASLEREGFIIITSVEENERISFYSQNRKQHSTQSFSEFCGQWDGKLLLIEPTERSKDKDYDINQRRFILNIATLIILFLGAIFLVSFSLFELRNSATLFIIQMLNLVGVIVGLLLVLKKRGIEASVTSNLCTDKNGKDQCKNVIHSKYAQISGVIDLSDLVFLNFTAMLSSICAIGIGVDQVRIPILLATMILGAVGFSILSIYYQSVKLRQWCMLCLVVSGIIWSQFGLLILEVEFISSALDIHKHLGIGYFIGLVLGLLLLLYVKVSIYYDKERVQNLLFKLNEDTFKAHLSSTNQSMAGTEKGIGLGNQHSENSLIAVLHLDCKHCSSAYNSLIDLIYLNDELQLNIRLAYSPQQSKLAEYIFDTYETTSEKEFIVFLEEIFRKKIDEYNTDISSQNQDTTEYIKANNSFFSGNAIRSYPAFIYNGKIVPSYYSVEELKLILA